MKTKTPIFAALLISLSIALHLSAALTDGLVAHYPLDGSAIDISGIANHGIVVGIPVGTDRFGVRGRCYDFTGNGYINIPNARLLDGATSATISGWFLRRASNTTGFVVGAGDSRSGFDPFSFVVTPTLQVQAQFTDTALSPFNPDQGVGYGSGPGLVQSNKWYHFAQTFSSGGTTSVFRLYINGMLVTEQFYTHTQRVFFDQSMPVQIGALTSFSDSRFVGLIDDVRFHNRQLSISEIQMLYSGNPPPAAGSPIGTWEFSIARKQSSVKETGTAYVTFNADHTLSGYGITTISFTLFTLSGTWSQDAKGQISAIYTEDLDGEPISGTMTGKAKAGKTFQGTIVAENGIFSLKGKPAGSIPNFSGTWRGLVTQNKTTVTEIYQVTALNGFPGVFEISGEGNGPSGPFDVEGAAILTSKGDITAFAFSDFEFGGSATVSLSGKLNVPKQTSNLNGMDLSGSRLRVKLSRQPQF